MRARPARKLQRLRRLCSQRPDAPIGRVPAGTAACALPAAPGWSGAPSAPCRPPCCGNRPQQQGRAGRACRTPPQLRVVCACVCSRAQQTALSAKARGCRWLPRGRARAHMARHRRLQRHTQRTLRGCHVVLLRRVHGAVVGNSDAAVALNQHVVEPKLHVGVPSGPDAGLSRQPHCAAVLRLEVCVVLQHNMRPLQHIQVRAVQLKVCGHVASRAVALRLGGPHKLPRAWARGSVRGCGRVVLTLAEGRRGGRRRTACVSIAVAPGCCGLK
jgi:hypothetical protein